MTGEKIRSLRKDHNKQNKNDDIMESYDASSNGTSNAFKSNKGFQQYHNKSQQQISNINGNNVHANSSHGTIVDDNKNPIILTNGEFEFPVHECVFKGDVRRLSSLIRTQNISQKDVHGKF